MHAAEQISYERSSQAQNLTDPPRVRKKCLLRQGLMLVIAGWRFNFVCKELELNRSTGRCCFICSDLCSKVN